MIVVGYKHRAIEKHVLWVFTQLFFLQKKINKIEGYKKANENLKYPIVVKTMSTIPILILLYDIQP